MEAGSVGDGDRVECTETAERQHLVAITRPQVITTYYTLEENLVH